MRAPAGRGVPPGVPVVTVPLTVRDLTPADLPGCGWSGSPLHLAHVEEDNPRARALYERLGYRAYGRQPEAWDAQGPDGVVRRHETMCTLLRKEL